MTKINLPRLLKKWRGVHREHGVTYAAFTQRAAAEQLRVPLKTYIDWEQGRRTPRGLALTALLERIQ